MQSINVVATTAPNLIGVTFTRAASDQGQGRHRVQPPGSDLQDARKSSQLR